MGDGYQEVQEVISIHAPTRGATSLKATEYKLSIDFNPRSHERSDNYIPDEFKSYIISIHAPTRGATMTSDETGMVAIFQSTLPREERPVRRYSLPLISVNFNPRSHERSDNIQNLTFALTKRFQSTLPREERRCMRVRIAAPLCNFNPRSHERSDVGCLLRLFYHLNFNPRSHERSDKPFIYKALRTIISIHAPTRGATMHQCRHSLQLSNFNPRSHERSDE